MWSVCKTYSTSLKVLEQTEAVLVRLEALLLCHLCEENRQKEAKGSRGECSKWGSFNTGDGEGWLLAVRGAGG